MRPKLLISYYIIYLQVTCFDGSSQYQLTNLKLNNGNQLTRLTKEIITSNNDETRPRNTIHSENETSKNKEKFNLDSNSRKKMCVDEKET